MTYEESKRVMLDQREEGRRIAAITGEALATPPADNSKDTTRQSKAERAKNKPGTQWARSTAGVYMNQHRRRMNGY